MHIQSVRIQNFRSIEDSADLKFGRGFNLIVGANNVGKSSLLFCLTGSITGEPHRSLSVLPTRDDRVFPLSRVTLGVTASGEEVKRLLLAHMGGTQYLPWPSGTPFDAARTGEVLARIFAAPEVPFLVRASAAVGQGPSWDAPEPPSMRLYPIMAAASNIQFIVDQAARDIVRPGNANGGHDSGLSLGQLILQKVYRFGAERWGLGDGPHGTNPVLGPAAQNLPEVLNILQGNPERFREYSDLVRRVLPSVQKVSVRPHPGGGGRVEIVIWQFDPASQREDLAIPLAQCGTGVGQVLSILYVVKTSEQPRTIIIDEPGSFLHPGAARALIGILKEFGKQHQYIVATHSPEIIAELADAPVTMVRWGDAKSQFEQFKSTTGHASALLNEIGARLSDVFGFDRVLWVEGQSDAQAFRDLLEAMERPQRRTAILPIRDTGSFKRRKIAEVMGIYRTLSMGDALLPPAVAFMFDREGRSEREIEDARRESEGKVRFLPYRMIENYFLRADLIARRFNELGHEHRVATTAEQVADWIRTNRLRFYPHPSPPELGSPDWIAQLDGAGMLEEMFRDLSGARLEYRKTRDTPRLAVLLHELNPAVAQELIGLISDVIE